MNREEEQEYQEKMGSPEMEYLQYLSEHPELQRGVNRCADCSRVVPDNEICICQSEEYKGEE